MSPFLKLNLKISLWLLITTFLSFINPAQGILSSNWSVALWSKLPRNDSNLILAYDSFNNIIWCLGGVEYSQQLISFDVNQWNSSHAFTDHGINMLSHNVYGTNTYTQSDNIVYIINLRTYTDGCDLYSWPCMSFAFSIFNLSSQSFTYNWKNISIPIDIQGASSVYACLCNTKDYLIISGGYQGVDISHEPPNYPALYNIVQIYNISGQFWLSNVPNMITARVHHGCIVHNNYLYAIGGSNTEGFSFNSVEKLYVSDMHQISDYAWNQIGTLSSAKDAISVVADRHLIYVLGGINDERENYAIVKQIDIINTMTDLITSYDHDQLAYPLRYGSSIVVNNRIYMFGGQHRSRSTNLWQYFKIPEPTRNPTVNPTNIPTQTPTNIPTAKPSFTPSITPTINPSVNPSISPTSSPTRNPTKEPSYNPSEYPTKNPSIIPTSEPTQTPTVIPSSAPTYPPTLYPTYPPTQMPTMSPT
eukprot:295668_1